MFSSLLGLKAVGQYRFEAPLSPDKGHRIFGGQFLAQSLRAAQITVAPGRAAHSLHGYFLRPGDVDQPLYLSVDPVRDGRAFSSREVRAEQSGRELFRMLVSFHVAEDSPGYAGSTMPDVPPPDEVELTYEEFTLQQTGEDHWPGSARPIDVRYINPPTVRGRSVTESQLMWMRVNETLPPDPGLHQAGLAYLSDSTLVDHVMLPHGMRWQDADFEGASLDHAMWFHHAARADEWLLFVQTVEATGSGRGLATGRFYDRAGRLVATCGQEGLMRWSEA